MKFKIGFSDKRVKSGKIKATFKVRRIYKFIKYELSIIEQRRLHFFKN